MEWLKFEKNTELAWQWPLVRSPQKRELRSAVYYHSPEKECEPLRTESAQLDDVPSADLILEHDAAARK